MKMCIGHCGSPHNYKLDWELQWVNLIVFICITFAKIENNLVNKHDKLKGSLMRLKKVANSITENTPKDTLLIGQSKLELGCGKKPLKPFNCTYGKINLGGCLNFYP